MLRIVDESIGFRFRGRTKIDLKLGLILRRCARMALLLEFRLTPVLVFWVSVVSVGFSAGFDLVAGTAGRSSWWPMISVLLRFKSGPLLEDSLVVVGCCCRSDCSSDATGRLFELL